MLYVDKTEAAGLSRFALTMPLVVLGLGLFTMPEIASAQPTPKVDLNGASEKDLQALPGVDAVTAKKIIAGRPYAAVADLTGAGISARTLERIISLVTIGGAPAIPPPAPAPERHTNASDTPHDQSQAKPPTDPAPPKPETPLFPSHGRGVYKNAEGVEVIDATPQSPPLETDDPGVPEKGEYEINLTTDAGLSGEAKDFDLVLVDVNYGLTFKGAPLQLKIEAPWSAREGGGAASRQGVGPGVVGVKYNLFRSQTQGVMVSLYPQVRFAVPGSDAVEKGLAETGQTLIVPLLVSKALTRFSLVGNLGVSVPIHAPDRSTLGVISFAIGCPVTRILAAMGEIRGESTLDLRREHRATVNLGLMRQLRGQMVGYLQAGRELLSADGVKHTFLGAGLKVLIKPRATGRADAVR